MADQYANRAAKVAVAQLAEAAGFDAVHQSSLDTLADLLLRYINEIGSASHSYAELAGRTESNPLDVLLALNDLGVSLGELSDYARMQEEIPFAQSIAAFPIKRKPTVVPTFLEKNEVPPSHVPGFLPAFPDKHTYVNTPAYAGHEKDPRKRQEKQTAARQEAVRAAVRLQARLAPDNKLLEKSAPGREQAAAGVAEPPGGAPVGVVALTAGADGASANPFLAPILWENQLDQQSVSEQPAGAQLQVGLAGAGAPQQGAEAAAAAALDTERPERAVAAAVAELAGEWQALEGGTEGHQGSAPSAPLFVTWDWKAHLQKKARLALSGGEQKDAYGQAYEGQVLETKHGRRAKRTERALTAHGDPTRRRVEEILAARQEEVDGGVGAAEEEGGAAAVVGAPPDHELI